jgi:transglutaminase-like putative cysteine protease/3-methyladenine DNA glycosylase AlkC
MMKMTNARIHIQWQYRTACLLVAAILFACSAQAQLSLKRQKYDSIAARYKNEHAVYIEDSRQLNIYREDGELKAKSTVVAEKLFISDQSLNTFNTDPMYRNTAFSHIYDLGANVWLPEKNDYRAIVNTDKYGNVSPEYSGLKKGSITRTFFTEQDEELRMLPGYYFGNSIPTISAVFEVRAPKYVKMGFLLKGADTSMIKRTVKEDGAMIIYRFTAHNVAAYKDYENVPHPSYYVTHIIPYIKSFRFTGAKKDSVLNADIDAHHRYEFNFVKGLNYKTDSFLNKKTKELIKGAHSDRQKVDRIFSWVQKYFHYEALYDNELGGFVPNPADTVCKRMYGDCKDMSSVLMAMYQKAGLPAYCAVIGTNNKPYTHDEIQSQALYNHMICAVKLDGEWVFPDGTTHVQPLGSDRWDIQGKEAMIMMDADHHKVVKIPEAPATANVTTDNTVMNLVYNDVTGTTYQHYSGYEAWEIGEVLAYKNREKEREEYVRALAKRGNNKFLLKSYNLDARKDGNKEVTITTDYKLGDYVQQVRREYFVNMNLSHTFTDLQVTEPDRNFPVYLQWKKTVKETVTLNIPKGYRVSHVPKGAKGGVAGLWSYSIAYKTDYSKRTITLTREYVLHTMKIEPSQFAVNNKLVNELKKQYKETVVLTAN